MRTFTRIFTHRLILARRSVFLQSMDFITPFTALLAFRSGANGLGNAESGDSQRHVVSDRLRKSSRAARRFLARGAFAASRYRIPDADRAADSNPYPAPHRRRTQFGFPRAAGNTGQMENAQDRQVHRHEQYFRGAHHGFRKPASALYARPPASFAPISTRRATRAVSIRGSIWKQSKDGKLCTRRDMLLARSGTKCEIDKLRQMVVDK